MPDDLEEQVLALAGQVRALGERLDGYDQPIAEINAMVRDLLATSQAQKPKTFHWPDLDPYERQEKWTALLEWVQNVLCARYPHVCKLLQPCWWQHEDVVDYLTAAWLTWVAAYRNPAAEPTDVDNWQKVYRPALEEQLASLSCKNGHNVLVPPNTVMSTAPTVID